MKADLQEQRALGRAFAAQSESARVSRDKFHAVNVRLESVQSQLTVALTARERLRNQQTQLTEQMKGVEQGIAEAGGNP